MSAALPLDPAPGPEGEQPRPGDGAPPGGDDDWDAAADLARWLDDIDSGREPIPSEEELHPQGPMFTLGAVADVDPAELAVMAGPDGLAGEVFAQHRAADAMRPGPLLSVLTEQAAEDPARLSDNQLLGLISAARRLQCRAEYMELAAIAEFTARSQARYRSAVAARVPAGRRDGEFAASELGMELLVPDRAAGDRMDLAADLASRLPMTFAGLGAGLIDGGKARTIWYHTRFLTAEHAAYADAILAAAAPRLRPESLARKAARLEMDLDPASVRARREHAQKEGRRVEARREASGNCSFGGRELSVEEALAAKAANDADAAALRRAGLPGTLRELRVLAMLDRMNGRNPLDRITAPAAAATTGGGEDADGAAPASPSGPGTADTPDGQDDQHPVTWIPAQDDHEDQHDDSDDDQDDEHQPEDGPGGQPGDGKGGDPGGPGGPGSGPGGPGGPSGPSGPGGSPPASPAPVPALINLVIPAGTLLGWSTTPGDAGTWGLLDPDQARSIVQAASQHPRSRWCLTVTGPDGTAVAHGCARGPHPWSPPTPQPPASAGTPGTGTRDGPGPPRDTTPTRHSTGPPGPDLHQQAQLAALLRDLNVTLAPIAKGTCDHKHRENRYTPSRALKHLVRARTATCIAPGCGAHASSCDLDHTIPYPDGLSCECNFGLPCRHHHRVKQAPGWHLEQPEPGVMRWTTPSGRVHTTTPTVYDV